MTTYEIVTDSGRYGRSTSLFEAKIMARQVARTTGRRASVMVLSSGSGFAEGRYAESVPYTAYPTNPIERITDDI